jgi:hypothetical protein
MKKISLILLIICLVVFGASMASATPVLYDWYIDVDGTLNQASYTYMAPGVGGDITSVSGFGMFMPVGDPTDTMCQTPWVASPSPSRQRRQATIPSMQSSISKSMNGSTLF